MENRKAARETSGIRAILTIDDVASKNTPAIVDYLKEKNIQTILFAVGRNLEQYPDQAKYALRHGMILGNHSYSHRAFSALPFEECVREIAQCEDALDHLYASAGVERKFRPFRFPYGDKGGANKWRIQEYLSKSGFHKLDDRDVTYPWWREMGLDKDIDTFWTFDFAEYHIRQGSGFTMEQVWERVRNDNPHLGGALLADGAFHILLLHAHDETEALAPGYCQQLMDYLLACGVTFVQPAFLDGEKSDSETESART